MRIWSRTSGLKGSLLNSRILGWSVEEVKRRAGWIAANATADKVLNVTLAAQAFLRKAEYVPGIPTVVKIDISPLCNLRCTVCLHAFPDGNPALEQQEFRAHQRMTVEHFRRIVSEIEGKASAVSLYYLGDPIVHAELPEFCRIARDAGLNVHVSTNLSVQMSEERVRRLVESGLTHLTVCVDGLSQAVYEKTRVNGRIDWVLSNLERIVAIRDASRAEYPIVEVQYIKFQHNVHELAEARRRLEKLGVDHIAEFWGSLHNYSDLEPGRYQVFGTRPARRWPRCGWPYFATLVKWNGDVIPCCNHRLQSQYVPRGDSRVIGNVFETSLAAIWNGPEYRAIRRLVSNPRRVHDDAHLLSLFCEDCPAVFDSDRYKHERCAREHRFEDLFEPGAGGHSIRRSSVGPAECDHGSGQK